MIILIIICVLLAAIVALMVWYVKNLLKKLLFISDNVGSLLMEIKMYQDHLNGIYEGVDLFYGDPVVEGMISHTKQIVAEIEKYKEIYSLVSDGSEREVDLTTEE